MSAPLPLADRNAEIVRLWNSDLTASAIAAQLEGVTRSMVLGVVKRAREHGLVSRGPGRVAAPADPAPERPAARSARTPPRPRRPARRRMSVEALSPHASNDPKEPIGCRWIEGDTHKPGWRYCQAPRVIGKSWCGKHLKRVFVQRDAQ